MALNNSQYEKIMQVYTDRRIAARRNRKLRIEEIEKKLPAYKEMQNSIVDINMERTKALIAGDDAKAEMLSGQLEMLASEKGILLQTAGFPSDYDKEQYTCPDCQDTGYTDGKKCHCFKKMEAELLYDASSIGEILDKENFETFCPDYFDKTMVDPSTGKTAYDTMEGNLEAAHEMADRFVPGDMNLLFTGNAGTGKTFLSNCIAREVIKQGYAVVYFSATTLFDRLAKGTFEGGSDTDTILGCDLLIIDDLGTELNNSFVSSQLFYCINERHRLKKSTIISTNYSINQIREQYSERVSSRMLEWYRICRFYNRDIRKIKGCKGQ